MTSTGTVISFFRSRQSVDRDWTQDELAQFYRVEAALIRSGLLIDVERGISDEGDPWFIFCRQDNGEVIAHFARIRDQYVIASSAFPGVARGKDFALLVSDLMRSSPLPVPREIRQAQNIYLHPAAMLVALLATAFMVSSESDGHDQHASHSLGKDVLRLLSLGEFAILSAVAIATTWIEYQIDSGLKLLEGAQTSETHNANSGDHALTEVVAAVQSLFKIDSDAATHKASLETALVSAENQHQTDLGVPGHALAGPPSSVHTSVEKISDLSVILSNFTSDSAHGSASSPPGSDALNPVQNINLIQSIVPESGPAVVSSQADHSPSVQQPIAQAAAAPAQISGASASTDAYHALAAGLTGNNLSVPVVSVANFSLDSSIQKALTSIQSDTSNHGAQTPSIAPTVTPAETPSGPAEPTSTPAGAPGTPAEAPSTLPEAHLSSSPTTFDAHAQTILQEFMSTNQQVQEELAGQHVLLVDNNQGDIANSHFGSLSWTFADGSTLTIVGIMPGSASAAVHASG